MQLSMSICDAFTQNVFSGNSAAVIQLDAWLEAPLMQKIAAQNNLSETAFLVEIAPNRFAIRWFSPLEEIDFCGHATLASAYVLFSQQNAHSDEPTPEIEFVTLEVGTLSVARQSDGRLTLDAPNLMPERCDKIPAALIDGLSIAVSEVWQNQQAYIVVTDHLEDLKQVKRDNALLKQLAPFDVCVTTATPELEYDFASRYFWPANGGDEDPVTGSMHSGLAPLWQQKLGKSHLLALQASPRGGILYCEVTDTRVKISGYVTLYSQATIYV